MKNLNPWLPILAVALSAPLFQAGCGVDSSISPSKAPAPPHAEPASAIVYPDGWDQIIIARQYDNEKIYGNAHWWIDRTDCGDEQYEPFDSDPWNQLASSLNVAIKPKPLSPDSAFVCSTVPDEYDLYNGTVTAQMSDGSTRTLYKIVNFQSCTSISDAGAAADALRQINALVVMANKYNCTNPQYAPPVPGM